RLATTVLEGECRHPRDEEARAEQGCSSHWVPCDDRREGLRPSNDLTRGTGMDRKWIGRSCRADGTPTDRTQASFSAAPIAGSIDRTNIPIVVLPSRRAAHSWPERSHLHPP